MALHIASSGNVFSLSDIELATTLLRVQMFVTVCLIVRAIGRDMAHPISEVSGCENLSGT